MESPSPGVTALDVLAVLALVGLVLGTVAAPAAGQSGGQGDDSPFGLAQTQVDADAVLLEVDLQRDGDARWQVEYRVRLDDENTTAAFEDLETDVEQNASAYVTRFADRMSPTVQDAAATTGREMTLRNVSVTTTTRQLPQTYGVLVYTFEWTDFAVVEGDELRAGDALAGFFLDADSALRLSWPETYSLGTVAPEPSEQRERSVIWRGPTEFGPDEPSLVVSTAGGGVGQSLAGVAIVVVVLVAGGALWWWRHHRGTDAVASDVGPGGDPTADTASGGSDRPPDELLSNEERVVALLEEHGGRMKQQAVVQALGWTDAKTSQVVGKLRETGEIEGFRLGRENVLRLPEVDESPAPGDIGLDRDK